MDVVSLAINKRVVYCLERRASAMTYYVSCEMLNCCSLNHADELQLSKMTARCSASTTENLLKLIFTV